jgi:hypothetical protein
MERDFILMDIKTKISLFIISSITIGMATASFNSLAFATILPGQTSDGLMHLKEAIQALKSGDVEQATSLLTDSIESF